MLKNPLGTIPGVYNNYLQPINDQMHDYMHNMHIKIYILPFQTKILMIYFIL